MRCALLEFNPYHGEILPAWVHVLNRLGVEADVFASLRIIRNDPLGCVRDLRYRQFLTGGPAYLWHAARRFKDYDFVVFNSIEPRGVLARAARFERPALAVLHNAHLLRENSAYREFFARPARLPVTLAAHAARTWPEAQRDSWLAPVLLLSGDIAAPPVPETARTARLCVQGNVEYKRRNYPALLDALAELHASGETRVHVQIAGRNHIPDGKLLRRQAAERGLSAQFSYTRRPFFFTDIGYRKYYATLTGTDFILPLVDDSPPYRAYLEDKLTSSVVAAIGLVCVPILHRRLAELYGIEDAALQYENGGLAQALRRASELKPDELARLRAALAQKRGELLAASCENIRALLQKLGLPAPSLREVQR